MILLVDIGNSRIKWARVSEGALQDPGEAPAAQVPEHIVRAMAESEAGAVSRIVATNVGGREAGAALAEAAEKRWGVSPEFIVPSASAHGIRCAYADPARLGPDRWAAMIAAHRLADGAVSVIDAGTTVTLDTVDAHGRHLGGLIMAGPRMVCAALARATSGIGPVDGTPPPPGASVLGTSTESAVVNGAMLAIAGGLDRALRGASAGAPRRPAVLISGGDGQMLSRWLETETRYRANLALEGLAIIAAES